MATGETVDPSEAEWDQETPVETFWARARAVTGDKRVWARVFLRAGLVALIPGGIAVEEGGYTLALPTLGAVCGVIAIMTLVERFVASGRRPSLLKTGGSLVLLAWVLMCLGFLEGKYVEALLESGDVAKGLSAVTGALADVRSGRGAALGIVGFALPALAGPFGLASALRVCNRKWGKERREAALLLIGHILLMSALFLVSVGEFHPGMILASLLSPAMGTVMLTSVVFAIYAGVDWVVQPEQSPRARREEARRAQRHKLTEARQKSSQADEGAGRAI